MACFVEPVTILWLHFGLKQRGWRHFSVTNVIHTLRRPILGRFLLKMEPFYRFLARFFSKTVVIVYAFRQK